MIFILQSLRNMFIHFHQCNDDAQREIDGSNQNNMDSHRKNRLIDIFKSIFPFLGDRLVFDMNQTIHIWGEFLSTLNFILDIVKIFF